ncbi:family 16 glycosylhydrolase [Arachnia propionica]|uniref:Glycosyl hydrolase family protein n=1 Tax=Arachnia propionica TaxID=1750 RepID=A0A3P1WQU4_9ACTN|nr:family 16 glycosylhydrolase [Arachnia propionica]RRD48972.1 glycosyl hydrolase family protein [Arachnia propionica]
MDTRKLTAAAALGVGAIVLTAGLGGSPTETTAEPAPAVSREFVPSSRPSSSVAAAASGTVAPDPLPQSPGEAPSATPTLASATPEEQESAASATPSSESSSTASRSDRTRSSEQANPQPHKQPNTQAAEQHLSTGQGQANRGGDNGSQAEQAEAELPGWRIDYFEGFDRSVEEIGWERYGWGNPPVGHGAMGFRSMDNVFTSGGELLVRTKYENGQWSAGGVSTKHVFAASRGRWEVRARFPQGVGIGYVFLLWPKDEGWPPEIDFAEGRVNGPEIMGVYHWDPDNKQEHRFFDNPTMSDWHTYGVIVEDNRIIFTFDGEEWGRIEKEGITDKEMFFGVQTGAMDPNGSEARYETVPNGVPGPQTPALTDIQIDWVAHYHWA